MDAAAASRTARLFDNDILKARPRKNRKYQVVESEEAEVAAGVVDHRRAHSADDHRNDERQEEERQEKLACAARSGHGGQERPDRGEPEIREKDRGDELPADRLEEKSVRRQRDRFGDAEEDEHTEALGEPDGAPVAGGENEPVEHPLLPLGGEGPAEPEERSEEERDPQEACGCRRGSL